MENFASLIFNGLGWAIIHSLWVGAILYGSLMFAFQFLNWRAKTKSLLLAVALSVLLAFFCLTFLYDLLDNQLTRAATITVGDTALLQLLDYNSSVSIKAYVEHYFPLVIAFYVLGVLFQLVVVTNGFRKLRIIRKQGLLEVPESWKALLASQKRRLGLRMPIAFHFSTLVDVPMVIGYLKPVILFPMALYSGMRMDQVEAVLIHELTHIKRNDYLINLVKVITETLLFFNPFVWLIGRMLEVERENACDDVVVDLTAKPIYYARTLLWLEEQRRHSSPSLAMQAIDKKKQLLHRIQRMTNMKKNYLNAKHKLAILTLMLGCIASLAWVKPFAEATAPTDATVLPAAAVDELSDVSGDSENIATTHVAASDTLQPGEKPNITFSDRNGTALTFKRYEDLPDSLKRQVDAVQRQADSIRVYFNSPEWKEKMEGMKLSEEQLRDMTAQVRKQTDPIRVYFNSPEWKEKMEGMKLSEEQLRDMTAQVRKQTDSLRAYFNSPEWKDKMKEHTDSLKRYFNSPVWKNNVDQWKREGRDTTLVWPTMTIIDSKRQETLAALQQQYAISAEKAQRYHRVVKQSQKPYIDGSMKPWLKLDSR